MNGGGGRNCYSVDLIPRAIILQPFFLKVRDDSMSKIRFRTTAKVKLLHLSYIFRKPEPLGNEFNKVA